MDKIFSDILVAVSSISSSPHNARAIPDIPGNVLKAAWEILTVAQKRSFIIVLASSSIPADGVDMKLDHRQLLSAIETTVSSTEAQLISKGYNFVRAQSMHFWWREDDSSEYFPDKDDAIMDAAKDYHGTI